tara:strand:+ start:221 stop:502 length:282 start_codon:yes stop_codon:yes gene_type:complete
MPDYYKGPNGVLDYTEDWTAQLAGDTISSSTWVLGTGEQDLTIDSESETTTSTTVWLSGGLLHREYEVTNIIVTSGGRTEQRTQFIHIVLKED